MARQGLFVASRKDGLFRAFEFLAKAEDAIRAEFENLAKVYPRLGEQAKRNTLADVACEPPPPKINGPEVKQ
jgi:hypothetical protein